MVISLSLVIILKIVNSLISESSSYNREELSAFECGFETHSLSRIPFSLRYFFLTLIFLLFDLEIVLLVFSPLFVFLSSSTSSIFLIGVFIIVLSLRLFYEFSDGTLDWVS